MTKVIEIKTRKNLEGAFAGESMAYQKYKYFAKIARKNGMRMLRGFFEQTAEHETKHAEGHLRFLYPMNEMTTQKCLRLRGMVSVSSIPKCIRNTRRLLKRKMLMK